MSLKNTDLEFKSTNGNMHACGHDMHNAKVVFNEQILAKGAALHAYCAMKCCRSRRSMFNYNFKIC